MEKRSRAIRARTFGSRADRARTKRDGYAKGRQRGSTECPSLRCGSNGPVVLVPMYVSTLDRPFAIKTLSTCNSGDHNDAPRNRRQSRFHTSSCIIRRKKTFVLGHVFWSVKIKTAPFHASFLGCVVPIFMIYGSISIF